MSVVRGGSVKHFALALVVWLWVGVSLPAEAAGTFFTTPQVLKEFFPKSQRVTYRKVKLGPAELAAVQGRLGYKPTKPEYVIFVATTGEHVDGYAVIDEDDGTCEQVDPAVPLSADCPPEQDNVTCRLLPKSVLARPGVVNLPAGCDEAGEPLSLDSPEINGDEDKLYTFMCRLPQLDSDFDGIGDECDLCDFAHDPDNSFYKDANNKVWPAYGQFCSGPYDPEKGLQSCEDAEDTDTDTESGGGTDTDAGSTGG